MREENYDFIYEEMREKEAEEHFEELRRAFIEKGLEPQNGRYLVKTISVEQAVSSNKEKPVDVYVEHSYYTEYPDTAELWFFKKVIFAAYMNVLTGEKKLLIGDSLSEDFFRKDITDKVIQVRAFSDKKKIFSNGKRYFADTLAMVNYIASDSQKIKENHIANIINLQSAVDELSENIRHTENLILGHEEDFEEMFENLYKFALIPDFSDKFPIFKKIEEQWNHKYCSTEFSNFLCGAYREKEDAITEAEEKDDIDAIDYARDRTAFEWLKDRTERLIDYYKRNISSSNWELNGYNYEVTILGTDDPSAKVFSFSPFDKSENLYAFGDEVTDYFSKVMKGDITYE